VTGSVISLHRLDLDAATGLPAKKEALKALQTALGAPQNKFVVVAVVSRVQAVNARFGYAVGDRVLATFAEHLKKNLGATDQLYRWHGPAVIALLDRADRIEEVRTEMRRFADVKLEKTIEVGARTVLLPISASWSVFAVEPTLDALLKRLEAFTAAQVSRELI
jgi:diguanylate cyclase (GGDEF)-like protein